MKKNLIIPFVVILFIFMITYPCASEENEKIFTLSECAKIGIDNSYQLKTYDSKVKQTVYQVKETLSAYNPNTAITGSSSYQKPIIYADFSMPSGLPNAGATIPTGMIIMPEWYHVYNLTVSKLITTFGKVEAAASLTKLGEDQARIQRNINEDTLLFQISQGFYQLLLAEQLLDIAKAQLRDWEEQFSVAQSRYKTGVVARYDLLRVQVSLFQSKDNVTTCQKNIDIARANLRTLMGLPVDRKIAGVKKVSFWSDEEEDRMKYELPKWYDIALSNHPAVKLGSLAHKQGESTLELAKLDNAPSVSFSSTYTKQTATFIGADWAWKNSVNLSIPLMDGGTRAAKIVQAMEIIHQADLTLEDTKKNVRWNVEQAYLNLHDLYPKIKTALLQIEMAEEGYRVARLRYKEGLGTIVEMVDAQSYLVNAQVNLQQTLYNFYTQMAALSYAAGIIKNDIFSSGRS